MPTVLRVGGYRFFFYSNEGSEPPHIHVQKAEKYAKFWLQPIQLADSIDYTSKATPDTANHSGAFGTHSGGMA